jgi:antitoxin ParD1/3/4
MPNVEQLSITLPAEIAQLIHDKVETGAYASSSDVISAALRAWQMQETARHDRLAIIRAKIAEADADPTPSLTEDEVDAYFAARLQSAQPSGDNA